VLKEKETLAVLYRKKMVKLVRSPEKAEFWGPQTNQNQLSLMNPKVIAKARNF